MVDAPTSSAVASSSHESSMTGGVQSRYDEVMRVLAGWSESVMQKAGFAVGLCMLVMHGYHVTSRSSASNFTSVDIVLVCLSIVNAYFYFSTSRTYTILSERFTKDPPEHLLTSSNAQRIIIESTVQDEYIVPQRGILSYFRGNTRKPNDRNVIRRTAWELHVWNPSSFCKAIFSVYSPVTSAAFILASNNTSSAAEIAFITIAFSLLIFAILDQYDQLGKDKHAIFADAYQVAMDAPVRPQLSSYHDSKMYARVLLICVVLT